MKTAVVYARYSSDKQTEQSIEGQLRSCQEYANRNDIVILDTYIDRAMTGTNDNRPDFQRMLKDSKKANWYYVLVYKLDRFSRDKDETVMHKHELNKYGVKVISAMENIPDTPEGIILEGVIESMNEYYSRELSQKVKRGMRESKIKGQFTGGSIIYGYKVIDKKIYIEETEAEIIRKIFSMYLLGKGINDILKYLNDNGIYNRNKVFKQNTIYTMLRNEKYIGILKYENEIYTNNYPPILDINLFQDVQKKINNNKYGKHCNNVKYLLKNKGVCGYCGNKITSESGTSGTGLTNRYYKCLFKKRGNHCINTPIRKELLEEIVISSTIKALESKENINEICKHTMEIANKNDNDKTQLNILIKEKTNIKNSIDNLLNCMEQGIVTNSTKQRIESLEEKLQQIETNIIQEKSKIKSNITEKEIKDYLRKYLKSNPEYMIMKLIDKIVLYNDKIEIIYTSPLTSSDNDKSCQGFLFYKYIYKKILNAYLINHSTIDFSILVLCKMNN